MFVMVNIIVMIDIFTFFLNSGQPEIESVRSAQRIFRGGATKRWRCVYQRRDLLK